VEKRGFKRGCINEIKRKNSLSLCLFTVERHGIMAIDFYCSSHKLKLIHNSSPLMWEDKGEGEIRLKQTPSSPTPIEGREIWVSSAHKFLTNQYNLV
jgi:hypothetical protein